MVSAEVPFYAPAVKVDGPCAGVPPASAATAVARTRRPLRMLAVALALPLGLTPLTPTASASASHSRDVDLVSVQKYLPEAGWGHTAATGDFTGDGLADAVMGSGGGKDTLWLFRQRPDRRLVQEGLPLPREEAYDGEADIVAIDVDRDGQQELLAAVQQSVHLYRGGSEGLRVEQTLDLGDVPGIYDVMVADWDGDGDQDAFVQLSTAEGSAPTGQRWVRNDTGRLSVQGPVLAGEDIGLVNAVADVTGDGRVDLVGWLWRRDMPPVVVVHSRDASGTWQRHDYSSSQDIHWIEHLAVADVTGDGRDDIVATTKVMREDANSTLEVFPQRPDGTLGRSVVHRTWQNADAITTGDLNGDGRQDVVVAYAGFDAVGVYQQTTHGTLEPERRFHLFNRSSSHYARTALQTGDMDADGHLDVVVATSNHGLQVMRQGPARPEPSARTIDGACPEGQVPASSFSDVPASSAHARAITCLLWWQVTSGRTASTYAPGDGVTREAMASFVARLVAAGPAALPEHPADAFHDDDGSVHQLAINQLAAVGIVGGTGDGAYTPRAVVNRGQMARFLANAAAHVLGDPLPAPGDVFADDDASVFEDDINRIALAGITGGLPDGTYGAGATVNRAQMASFLARTLDVFVEYGAARPPE
jgi:hypothetical protein